MKVNRLKFVHHDEICKIALVNFGYRNGDLIRLLIERGAQVGQGNFNGIGPIEVKINELLKSKSD